MRKSTSQSNFEFKSKSYVLKYLTNKIRLSKIENIYDFTISEWKINKQNILKDISKNFRTKIIVRSSAIGEDSIESSHAGNFESVLDVESQSTHSVTSAISKVIKSYKKAGFTNPNNQILIQNQSKQILYSGVIFTRDSELSSPYYVINFDKGTSTVGVTAGSIGNVLKIFRKSDYKIIPSPWNNLLDSIREIENILQCDKLDIEFGINKKFEIIIYQVMPITFIFNNKISQNDKQIQKCILKNKNKFLKLQNSKLFGNQTFYSDMADWNPAEIIGNNPNIFDYSLYDLLIMKDAWSTSRKKIGYANVHSTSLMKKFGNKPYVDIRASFNSFLPENLSKLVKKKLLNYYLTKLQKHPYLHDKVEFEILFSCYDFMINERLKELKQANFSYKEIKLLKSELLEFTNNIIHNFPKILETSNRSISIMNRKRKKLLSTISPNSSYQELLSVAEKLLFDCKHYGTIPFSTMARIAFISTILLKSIQKTGLISHTYVEHFLNSISTPLSDIQNDLYSYKIGKISKNDFLKKYGHLRPGTYDITANRYDKQEIFLDSIKTFATKKKIKKRPASKDLSSLFKKHNLKFNSIDFFDFVEQSLSSRENLKFEFTKNLSAAIELIVKAGNDLGFSKNDLANIEIKKILGAKNSVKNEIKQNWRKFILNELQKKSLNSMLVLPPLIFSKNDFEIINYFVSHPNFITNKKITSSISFLNAHSEKIEDIENNIVLIENADPGFDWIFTKNPSGLITKYGGVASHMAIRCAEIGLPAAIGCGEILYEKLKSSSTIMLDCKNQEIFILEHSSKDDELEARKVLKSLGYIK